MGLTDYARVTIKGSINPLRTLATTYQVATDDAAIFSVLGGEKPYRYTLLSGAGTLHQEGAYHTPAAAETASIQVTDAAGSSLLLSVVTTQKVQLKPLPSGVSVGATVNLEAQYGFPPYQFQILQGQGSISSGGLLTAPRSTGTLLVGVTDSKKYSATLEVRINELPQIVPFEYKMAYGTSLTLTTRGGTAPYIYSVSGCSGTITSTGVFTAPTNVGALCQINSQDKFGLNSTAKITITDRGLGLQGYSGPTLASAGNPMTLTPVLASFGTPTSYKSSDLPAGLGINSSTGVISGAPTAPGPYLFAITASNTWGELTISYTLTVIPDVLSVISPTAGST
jgi:hypothetical protein